MLVYSDFGISLPDDPAAQYGYGTPVDGPPQAGDLVFWAEGGGGITHVGIAIGNGYAIHAQIDNVVTETPIDAIPGYVGARRLLDDSATAPAQADDASPSASASASPSAEDKPWKDDASSASPSAEDKPWKDDASSASASASASAAPAKDKKK
jgi:hypothetical protein